MTQAESVHPVSSRTSTAPKSAPPATPPAPSGQAADRAASGPPTASPTAEHSTDHVDVDPPPSSHAPPHVEALGKTWGDEHPVPKQGLVSHSSDGSTRTRRPDGSTVVTGPDGESTTREQDGTRIVRDGSRTTVTHPDGRVDVTDLEKDGDRLTSSTYTRHGAKVTEHSLTHPNGESRTVSEVTRGQRTERTVSVTRNLEGDVQDRADEFTNGDIEQHIPQLGDELTAAGPQQATHTVRTVTNGDVRGQVLDDSTTYSQAYQTPLEADVTSFSSHPLVAGVRNSFNDSNRTLDLSGYGEPDSGTVRLAVTETRLRNGQVVDERRVGARSQFQATAPDGHDVPVERNYDLTIQDGKRVQETITKEFQGISRDNLGGVFDKSEYPERLRSGPIDYRETVVQPYNDQGVAQPATQSIQAGDIYSPNAPGSRTIAVDTTFGESNADFQRAWTYHRADSDGQGGVRVREQTNMQGSDAYTLTDGHLAQDGSSRFLTKAYDGDQLLLTQIRDRRQVPVASLRPEDFSAPDLARDFLHANPDGKVLRDSVTVINYKGDDEPPSHSTTSFTAASGDSLQEIHGADQSDDDSTILQRPHSAVPFQGRAANGDELQVKSDGKLYRIAQDGASQQIGDLGVSALSAVKTGASLTSKVSKALGAESVAGSISGYLGGLKGALALSSSDSTSQTLSGASDVVGGLSSLADGASKLLAKGGMSQALSAGGKVLGAAGSVLGIGSGVAQIAEGDTVGGGFTIAASGGSLVGATGSALGAGALVPGVGWVVAGLGLTGGLIYDVIQQEEAQRRTHELLVP